MKAVLFLLALPLAAQTTYLGVTGDYAKSLGYNPAPAMVTIIQGDRSWTEINGGPLEKTTVAGGAQLGGETQTGVVQVGGTWITCVLDLQEEMSSVWRKTTLGVGPGVRKRFADGTQMWAAVQKNFITPNGGELFAGGVQIERGRFILLSSFGGERFDQPFTVPVRRGLWGIELTAGVAFRVAGPRRVQ